MMARPAPSRRIWIAGGFSVLVFLALIARFWHPVYGFTAFFQLDATNDDLKLAALRELPVYVYRDTGGYDGLYYAQIALDPTLRDPTLPRAMDNFAYRARRILPPGIAWLTGAGRPSAVITAYALLNVFAWLVLAGLLWRILDVRDARGWIAWCGVLFSAGALCSVRLALTDLIGVTLIAVGIFAAERQRKRAALISIAASALSRETSLLAVAGLLKAPWISWKNVARIALAMLPLLGWLAYVRRQVGPADAGWGNLTLPVVGFVEKWREVIAAPARLDDAWLAWTSALALIGLSVQALYLVLRPHLSDRWWRVGAAYVALMLVLGTAVWEGFPGAALRVLLPLTLAFNVVAQRARASLIWLIAGNLGMAAGLLTLRDVPTDPHEIAAARTGTTACIADLGTGWYGPEATRHHTWYWAKERGKVDLVAWPKSNATIRLEFAIRAMTPRTVILRADGREVWRAAVGTTRADHAIEILVHAGTAALEFTSDAAPVRENETPIARELGFALYDFRLAVPNE